MRMEPPEGGSTMFEYDAVLNSVFLNFYGTLWSEGKLDQATKEVERIRSARAVGCETCRNLRFSGAQEQGLTEADVDLLEDGYAESELSPRWKAALAWSDAVTGAPRVDAPKLRESIARGVLRPRVRRAHAPGRPGGRVREGHGRVGAAARAPRHDDPDADSRLGHSVGGGLRRRRPRQPGGGVRRPPDTGSALIGRGPAAVDGDDRRGDRA